MSNVTILPPVPDAGRPSRFWTKVKRTAGRVPFLREAVALYFCARDPETPWWAKGIAIAAVGYFVFPIDAIPDAIPVVGLVDDAGIVMAAVAALGRSITARHLSRADGWLGVKPPAVTVNA